MIVCGYSVCGEEAFSNSIPSTSGIFDVTYFYGDMVVDQLHMRNYELTDAEIIDKYNAIEADTWNDGGETNVSVFLANFEDPNTDPTLEAGSVFLSSFPLDHYVIRRKLASILYFFETADGYYFQTDRGENFCIEGDDVLNNTLTTVDTDVTTYKDYTAKNNVDYIYTVYPAYTDETEGQGIEGSGTVSFWAWILSSTDGVDNYVFDIDVDSSDIEVNEDFHVFPNYTQFPSTRRGARLYVSGSLTTMPASVSGDEYTFPTSELNSLISFLNNTEDKILRNPNGEGWKVQTNGAKRKYMDKVYHNGYQPYTITFSYTQIDDI